MRQAFSTCYFLLLTIPAPPHSSKTGDIVNLAVKKMRKHDQKQGTMRKCTHETQDEKGAKIGLCLFEASEARGRDKRYEGVAAAFGHFLSLPLQQKWRHLRDWKGPLEDHPLFRAAEVTLIKVDSSGKVENGPLTRRLLFLFKNGEEVITGFKAPGGSLVVNNSIWETSALPVFLQFLVAPRAVAAKGEAHVAEVGDAALQQFMEEIDEKTQLDVPLEPSYEVDAKELEKWIEMHRDPRAIKAARIFAGQIRRISFQEWYGGLTRAVTEFLRRIRQSADRRYFLLYPAKILHMDARCKSNWWVSQHVLRIIKRQGGPMPVTIVGSILQGLTEHSWKIRHFLLCDDAIFSGTQIDTLLSDQRYAIMDALEKTPSNEVKRILEPFMTRPEEEEEEEEEEEKIADRAATKQMAAFTAKQAKDKAWLSSVDWNVEKLPKVHIVAGAATASGKERLHARNWGFFLTYVLAALTLDTLEKNLSAADAALLKNELGIPSNKPVVYFQHKMPDFVSVPQRLGNGGVWIRGGVQVLGYHRFIKGCQVFNKTGEECPAAFYKRVQPHCADT